MPRSTKIEKIEVIERSLELHVPFSVAYGTTSKAELTLVKVTDSNGQYGLGESAPPSYMNPKQKKICREKTESLASQTRGLDCLDALKLIQQSYEDYYPNYAMAYCAVELALEQLHAKQTNQPLFGEFKSSSIKTCKTDLTIPLMPTQAIAPFWERFENHGFDLIKVKVSGDLDNDLEALQEIDRVLPGDVQIFLDGNQGFSKESVIVFLRRLDQHNIRPPLFFEQPLPKDQWTELKELRQSIETPVCLDESVTTASDAMRAAKEQTAPLINLKFMKSGVRETLKITKIAAQHGIDLMIGGMVESEITMNASLAFFCRSGLIKYADLDTPFFIKEFVCHDSPWHLQRAELKYSEAPLELK
jgi:L-Ala-D/L-Glu epimerase